MGNIGKDRETKKIQVNKATEIRNGRRNEKSGGPD